MRSRQPRAGMRTDLIPGDRVHRLDAGLNRFAGQPSRPLSGNSSYPYTSAKAIATRHPGASAQTADQPWPEPAASWLVAGASRPAPPYACRLAASQLIKSGGSFPFLLWR